MKAEADSARGEEGESCSIFQQFSTALPDDTIICRLHSILTIEDNKIAVIDFNNKKLKLFNESGAYLHSIKFDHHPRRACLTPDEDIIVTLKGINQLIMIGYINHQLRIIKIIQTEREYIDIDAIDRVRLVTNMHDSIDVINYEGRVLNRINNYFSEGTECPRMKFLSSLRTKNNLIYTTEICNRYSSGSPCMVCCDLFGRVEFVYKGPKEPLSLPCGVTLDKYGNIYVACRRTGRIYQITPNGLGESLIFSMPNRSSQPWCMWITENLRLMFTEYETSIIRVIQLPDD